MKAWGELREKIAVCSAALAKITQVAVFQGHSGEASKRQCGSQERMRGVVTAGRAGNSRCCDHNGSGYFGGVGIDFYEGGKQNAEMGRILRAMQSPLSVQ